MDACKKRGRDDDDDHDVDGRSVDAILRPAAAAAVCWKLGIVTGVVSAK